LAVEDVVRFLVRAVDDPSLRARIVGKASSEVQRQARQSGFAFTQDELSLVVGSSDGELSEEQLAGASGGTAAPDPNELIQYVLRQSYQESYQELQHYADKVKSFNEMKRSIRRSIRD
jgi:predicted ribosomally synthesized peptide with nif11-like leader